MADVKIRIKVNEDKYFDINKFTGLKSVESLYQSTSDAASIVYQTIPNYGSCKFVNSEIEKLIVDGLIEKDKTKIQIMVGEKTIQHHSIESVSSDKFKKEINFELTNKIRNFEKYTVASKDFTYFGVTLYDILGSALYEASLLGMDFYTSRETNNEDGRFYYPEFDKMCDSKLLYNGSLITVKEYLKKFYYNFPYESQNLGSLINKILEATLLTSYINENDEIKFISARPIFNGKSQEDCIIIPSKNQFSEISSDIVKNNKIKNISVKKYSEYTKYIPDTEGINEIVDSSENIVFSTEIFGILSNKENNENYDIQKLSNGWYVGRTKVGYNKPLKNNAYVIRPESEPYVVAEITSANGSVSKAGSDVFQYNSYNDFLQEVSSISGAIDFKCGYCTKLNSTVSRSEFAPYTEYFFAYIPYSTYNISKVKFHYGCSQEAEIFEEDKTETVYGDVNDEYSGISFSSNEFLNTNTVENFQYNLLNDYKDGIMTAKLSVSGSDYYNINNKKVIDWSKNETLKIGDIVRIDENNNGDSAFKYGDNNDVFWKITSINFRYSGAPFFDLELQEIKL